MCPDVFRGPWGGSYCRDSPVQTVRKCGCTPGQNGQGGRLHQRLGGVRDLEKGKTSKFRKLGKGKVERNKMRKYWMTPPLPRSVTQRFACPLLLLTVPAAIWPCGDRFSRSQMEAEKQHVTWQLSGPMKWAWSFISSQWERGKWKRRHLQVTKHQSTSLEGPRTAAKQHLLDMGPFVGAIDPRVSCARFSHSRQEKFYLSIPFWAEFIAWKRRGWKHHWLFSSQIYHQYGTFGAAAPREL